MSGLVKVKLFAIAGAASVAANAAARETLSFIGIILSETTVVDETNLAITTQCRFQLPIKNYLISINLQPNECLLA